MFPSGRHYQRNAPCIVVGGECTSTASRTLITPGCRSVRSFFRAFLARGSWDRFAVMSKEKMLQLEPSSYSVVLVTIYISIHVINLTLLVPLYNVQIDSSISTLSPKLYGNGGPCAMADATADLRKFIPVAQWRGRQIRRN